jgi:hypothetical protein
LKPDRVATGRFSFSRIGVESVNTIFWNGFWNAFVDCPNAEIGLNTAISAAFPTVQRESLKWAKKAAQRGSTTWREWFRAGH